MSTPIRRCECLFETRPFQARPLYEKLGYVVTGQIEGYPGGET
jgi:hypothetical protein